MNNLYTYGIAVMAAFGVTGYDVENNTSEKTTEDFPSSACYLTYDESNALTAEIRDIDTQRVIFSAGDFQPIGDGLQSKFVQVTSTGKTYNASPSLFINESSCELGFRAGNPSMVYRLEN